MADNVTGQIGADQVFLDNAATEATLRLILQATLATTKEQRKAIQDLVQKAGLDPTKVEAANEGLSNISTTAVEVESTLTRASNQINKVFNETARIVSQFTNNSMQASGVFKEFTGLGGPMGLVANGLSRVAEYQEASLKSYQALTNSGMSFSGSLTDLRIAASNSHMSLEDFTKMVTTNSDTLSRMGGSTENGVRAFSALSKELNASGGVGDSLRAMGYTSNQMNQSMLSYIAITGGRTKSELANTSTLTASAAGYMEQLDRLAEVTGKSREKQEEELKAAMQEADVQVMLSRMSVEDREAFSASMEEASALYGQAGRDVVIAQAQGRAVTGKAGQIFMATASGAAQTVGSLQAIAKQYGRNSQEFIDASNKSRNEAGKAIDQIPVAVLSTNESLKGGLKDVLNITAKDAMNGMTSREAMSKADQERDKEKQKRAKSEAADAAKTQEALQKLGGVIMEKIIAPINSLFMPVINKVVQVLSSLLIGLSKIPGAFEILSAVIAAVTLRYVYQKAAMAVGGAKGVAGNVLGALTGGGGGGANVGKAAGGGLGSALSGIGKGVGTGLKGLASGLGALGKPNVFAGIAALGLLAGALYLTAKAFQQFTDIDWIQVGIGTLAIAGIATAAALAAPAAPFIAVTAAALLLLGGALWAMAEGLSALSGSGGGSDALVGLGKNLLQFEKDTPYMRLGAAAIPLAAFGLSLLGLSSGLSELQKLDTSKLNKIADSLARIKDALPPERSLIESASGLIKSGLNALSNTISGEPAGGKAGGGGGSGGSDTGGKTADPSEMLRREMQTLNKQTADLLRVMRESANSTEKTASILAARGNLFRS